MMQIYVKSSDEALDFYQRAFNAKVVCSYPNSDGTLAHSELDIYGQILAITELNDDDTVTGNTMQFCLHLGEGKDSIIRKIYDALEDGAKILYPLGECE